VFLRTLMTFENLNKSLIFAKIFLNEHQSFSLSLTKMKWKKSAQFG
jgi:hypothetical protein